MFDKTKLIPHTYYSFSETGDVYDWKGNKIDVVMVSGKPMIKLNWFYGEQLYDLALVLLIADKRVELPEDLYEHVEPLYIDGKVTNAFLSNLTYRFKNGPLQCVDKPGFYYIPFFTNYIINKEGVVVSRITGKEMRFHVAPPAKNKKITAGYKYARLVCGRGDKMAALHRILCFAFKRYEANIGKMVVNHKDGDPTNNALDNLEIVTNAENNKHALENGLKAGRSIPFLVKNLITGEIKRYSRQQDYISEVGNVSDTFVSYRLRAVYRYKPADNLVFKYDDGSEWPKFGEETTSTMRDVNSRTIAARNVFTGEVILFNGTLAGQDLLGVKAATIYAQIEYMRNYPVQGYNFRYIEDGTPPVWPEHSEWDLCLYKDNPIYPTDGVVVVDEATTAEIFFTSKKKAGEKFSVTEATILDYIQNSKRLHNRYSFRLYKPQI